MRVRASVPGTKTVPGGYVIEGELDATFLESGSAVIGQIPAFRIVAQGNSRLHAHALLQRLFAEYCTVAAEQNLYEVLIKSGFKLVASGSGGRGASQFLNISEVIVGPASVEPSDDRSGKDWEVEFAGASR